MNNRVLVFGGSGFIGSNTIEALKKSGYNVLNCDVRNPYRFTDHDHETIDINDYNQTTDIIIKYKPDYIYNFAAIIRTSECVDQSLIANDTNIRGLYNILESIKCLPSVKRLLFPSTEHIYVHERITDKLKESDVLNINISRNIYPNSKLICESLIRSYNLMYGLPYTIFRYGTAYGPTGHHDSVTHRFVTNILHDKPVTISGDCRRNYMFIDDHVRANLACLDDSALNQTFNFTGGRCISTTELYDIIIELTGRQRNVTYERERVKDYIGGGVCIDKAASLLNWRPEISIESGINKLLKSVYSNENRMYK